MFNKFKVLSNLILTNIIGVPIRKCDKMQLIQSTYLLKIHVLNVLNTNAYKLQRNERNFSNDFVGLIFLEE